MEYNSEQIIKALECCIKADFSDCAKCPYIEADSCSQLTVDVIALIKELTEENERLRAEHDDLDIMVKDLRLRNKELQKANEGLAKNCEELESELSECVQIKADTVRKMQEALEHRIHSKLSYHGWYLKETVIAGIAKEILEGGATNDKT